MPRLRRWFGVMETRRGARGKRRTAGSTAKAREVLRPPRRAKDDGEKHGNGNYARLKAAATNSTAAAKAGGLKTAATLRFRTAGSQDESGCSAIHKLNGEGNGARAAERTLVRGWKFWLHRCRFLLVVGPSDGSSLVRRRTCKLWGKQARRSWTTRETACLATCGAAFVVK